MSDYLDQIPSLKVLLDFDGLIKNTSISQLQGRLGFLMEAITSELADFKVNAKNPDLVEKALLNHLQEAMHFSGGNLSSVKPLIFKIFGYRTFDLKTDFNIEKEKIRQLLIWSPDCTWSYNELWEELKPRTQSSPASFLTAPDVRRYSFGLIYQEALNSLSVSLKSPTEEKVLESTLEDQKENKIMTRVEVAKYMNVSVGTIDNWVKLELLVRIKNETNKKGAVRFRFSDVERCLEKMTSLKGKRQSKY